MAESRLANTNDKPKFSVAIRTETYQRLINETLGDKKTALQFIADISTVVANNYQLSTCESGTILAAGLAATTLKLPLNQSLGFAYIVPFGGKAQFQVGVKGYIQLAIRSGYYLDIDTDIVREGEYKGRDKQTGKPIFEFIEDDDQAEKKPIIGYRAYFTLLNGFTKTVYWSKAKIEQHRDRYSKSAKSTGATNLWRDQFDLMALKTVLRQLISKWGIMSVEMQTAFEKDQAIIKEDGKLDYVDNPENDGSVVVDQPQPTVEVKPEPKKELPKPEPKKEVAKSDLPFPEVEKGIDDLF